MSHTQAALTYAKALRNLGYGEPQWQPEPHDEDGEVLLGDVGFVEDGRFCRLFNVTRSADDPIHEKSGVPTGFKVLEYNENALIRKNPNYLGPDPIHSKSVKVSKIEVGAEV